MRDIQTDYLDKAIDIKQLPKTINKLVAKIRKSKIKFDTIAFRGNSGAIVAPLVAIKLKKELLLIRKGASHASLKIEGNCNVENYIIIDDVIETGTTIKTIINGISKFAPDARPVGIFLYDDVSDRHFSCKEHSVPVICNERI